MDKHNLEERLINFAVLIIELINEMPASKAGNHLSGQLVRSGTSPALNYGEAQSGESRKDFIHKIKIVLKELRESYNCLRIIYKSRLYKSEDKNISTLNITGMLLGISKDSSYQQLELELKKNDKILFFSDGYSETLNYETNEMLSTDAVAKVLKNLGSFQDLDISLLEKTIIKDNKIKSFDDDRTLLLINRL